MMDWHYSDGGRAAAGFKGKAGDCATRAIAIATGKPYREVYDALAALHATGKTGGGKRTARNGISTEDAKRYMASLGWRWVPTMGIGTGCTMTLNGLPYGSTVARVSKHYVAVIDGVAYDDHDSTREGKRCVYGYFVKG